jgi:hypothetical protein
MERKQFGLLTVIMVLCLMLIFGCCTTNAEDENAEGVWTYLPVGQPIIDVVGPYTFMTISDASDFTGTFIGSADDFGEVAIHSSGPMYYKGIVPFDSVTVNGKTGGIVLSVYGTKPNPSADAKWDGKWIIKSATGELVGLKGHGTWEGPGWQGNPEVPGIVNYSGSIFFKSDDDC